MRNQGIGLFMCLWLLIPRLNFPKGVYENLRWHWWIWDVNGVLFPLCCWWISIHSNRQSPSDAQMIEKMMAGYDEGRVVFDRYIDPSLKNKTWQKRANTSIEYEIYPQIKLTMSIEELLSASSTKKKLTCMMGQGLLDCFSRDTSTERCLWYHYQGSRFWGVAHTQRGQYLDSSSGPCFCSQWCKSKTVHLVSRYWCTAATAWSSILWTRFRPICLRF